MTGDGTQMVMTWTRMTRGVPLGEKDGLCGVFRPLSSRPYDSFPLLCFLVWLCVFVLFLAKMGCVSYRFEAGL